MSAPSQVSRRRVLRAMAGAALAAAAAWPGWRWVRAGGHRREGDEGPLPRATWLVPLSALVGGALAGTWSDQPALAVVLVLASVVLLLLCAVDLDVHRLPDVLTGPAFVGVLLGLLVVALATGAWGTWRRAVLAALVLGLVYLVLVIAGPWMLNLLVDYTRRLFTELPWMIG